ncbi:ZIP family metal transporter [Fodinicurvata sp. EGI_FJ10296]|uniref:ZIP family metal transporter n=1 Tax=Fodinicurvata sp. EGI_FJ10296 TaxID=3231908 RepID=UPI0034527FA6
MDDPSTALVFVAALLTAIATGVGALPLLWARQGGERLQAVGGAVAGGLMIGASIQLIIEGTAYGLGSTVIGAVLGAVFMAVAGRLMPHGDEMKIGEMVGADARKAVLIVGVMTVHSAAEGIGVGVSFGGGADLGWLMTLAIGIHNMPEGLAIALVLVPRGVTVLGAAWWSIFSSLPQPLLAVPAFASVALFEPLLPAGLGLAAGAMIWMAATEMLPDSRARLGLWKMTVWTSGSALCLLAFASLMVGS